MFPLLLLLLAFLTFVTYIWLVVIAFKKSPLWGFLVLFFSPITAIIFGIKYWQDAKMPFLAFILTSTVYFGFLFHVATQLLDGSGIMELAGKVQRGEQISEEEMAAEILAVTDNMAELGFISQEQLQKIRREFYDKFPQPPKSDSSKEKPAVTAIPTTPSPAKPEITEKPKVEAKPQTSATPPSPEPEIAAAAKTESKPQTPRAGKETKINTDAPVLEETKGEPAAPSEEEIEQALEEIEQQEKTPQETGLQTKAPTDFQQISWQEAGRHLGKKVKIIDQRGKVHIGRLEKVEPNRLVLKKLTGLIYSYDIKRAAIKTIMVKK